MKVREGDERTCDERNICSEKAAGYHKDHPDKQYAHNRGGNTVIGSGVPEGVGYVRGRVTIERATVGETGIKDAQPTLANG